MKRGVKSLKITTFVLLLLGLILSLQALTNPLVPESTQQTPAAPSNLVAIAISPTSTVLEWKDNSANEDGFKIERKLTEEAQSAFSEIAQVPKDTTNFSDTGLLSDTKYTYRVKAFNDKGDSTSNEATTRTGISIEYPGGGPRGCQQTKPPDFTLQKCIDDLREKGSGHIIELKEGEYKGSALGPGGSLEISYPLTLRSVLARGHKVTIQGEGLNPTIRIRSSWVTIGGEEKFGFVTGLKITHVNKERDGIIVDSSIKNITIMNNSISGTFTGITLIAPEDITIVNNIISGNSIGIALIGAKKVKITGNEIKDNKDNTGPGHGIHLTFKSEATISENVIIGNGGCGINAEEEKEKDRENKVDGGKNRIAGNRRNLCGNVPREVRSPEIWVPTDFSTIQTAIDGAEPGDEILIAPGEYHHEKSLIINKSLTLKPKEEGGVVKLVAQNPSQPVINFKSPGPGEFNITIGPNVGIVGGDIGVQIKAEAGVTATVTLKDSTIGNPEQKNGTGIEIEGVVEDSRVTGTAIVKISGSIIQHSKGAGIVAKQGGQVIIENATIRSNGAAGIFVDKGAKLEVIGQAFPSLSVEENTSDGIFLVGVSKDDAQANMQAKAEIKNAYISKNANGISRFSFAKLTITNSEIRNNKEQGILLRAHLSIDEDNVTIMRSQMIANNRWGVAGYRSGCFLGVTETFNHSVVVKVEKEEDRNTITENGSALADEEKRSPVGDREGNVCPKELITKKNLKK